MEGRDNGSYLCERCNNAFRFVTQEGRRTVSWRYCTQDGTCIETSVIAQVMKCRTFKPLPASREDQTSL